LSRLAATQAAATAARNIERFAGATAEQLEELGPMLQTVAKHHAGALLDALERAQGKDTRQLLLRVLPAAGAAVLPMVRDRLRSPDWFVVRNMVALLRHLGGRSIDLFSVAQHESVSVRMEVVRTLRAMPIDEQAAGILIDYLADPEREIRGGAIAALAEAELPEHAIGRLEAMAVDERRPEEARRAAVRALGGSRSNAAAHALYRMLEPKALLEAQATSQLRDRIALALYTSKAPEASELFARALKSAAWRVRKACERAMEGPSG
jgi:HEAT repeat protein